MPPNANQQRGKNKCCPLTFNNTKNILRVSVQFVVSGVVQFSASLLSIKLAVSILSLPCPVAFVGLIRTRAAFAASFPTHAVSTITLQKMKMLEEL
jgi:hypothetical protein